MAKFIVDNRSKLNDVRAIELVISVMSDGKISGDGKQYCYATAIRTDIGDVFIYCQLNAKSFKFTVVDDKETL